MGEDIRQHARGGGCHRRLSDPGIERNRMDYGQAMAFLEETKKYGSRLGLASIRTLLSLLGNIQDEVPAVHIAGTNGKGSVGAMLSSVLTASGYHVGHFSTPDVFSYEEEFMLDGKPVGRDRLAQIYTDVEKCCKKMCETGRPHPTRFEVETAAAFLLFYEESCEIALIEVGMGGETDATNVIRRPLVSVITPISMDHMRFLGDSLAEIAGSKAGIIKAGCPVVTARQEEAAMDVIRERSRQTGSACICADARKNVRDIRTSSKGGITFSCRLSESAAGGLVPSDIQKKSDAGGSIFRAGEKHAAEDGTVSDDRGACFAEGGTVPDDGIDCFAEDETVSDDERDCLAEGAGEASEGEWTRVRVGLSGIFQAENALCAIETLRLLRDRYPRICERTVREGLENVRWPGRFEKIGSAPDFYLDGAHNEGAARRLRETIELYFCDASCGRTPGNGLTTGHRIFYIMGVLADKEYRRMAEIMFSPGDKVFTVTPQNPRALDGQTLADLLRGYGANAAFCETEREAVYSALREARPEDVVIAFGSLSYLKKIREAYACGRLRP